MTTPKSDRRKPDDRRFGVSLLSTLGAIAGLAVVGLGGLLLQRRRPGNAEHPVPDLAADKAVGAARAPDAFRPDPTAAVPASERDGLRPATGPSPSLVHDRGAMNSVSAPLAR